MENKNKTKTTISKSSNNGNQGASEQSKKPFLYDKSFHSSQALIKNADSDKLLRLVHNAAVSGSANEIMQCFKDLVTHKKYTLYQESLDQCLYLACENGRKFLAQILLNQGANTETRDKDGNTPLLICAEKGFTDIALLLVDKGADINSYNKDGDTALLLSIKTSGSSQLVKKLLEKSKLKINHTNNNGYSALMKALEVLDLPLCATLLKRKAKFSAAVSKHLELKNSNSERPADAKELAESLGLKSFLDVLVENSGRIKSTLQNLILKRDEYLIQLFLESGIFKFKGKQGNDDNLIGEFLITILESKNEMSDLDLKIIKILLDAGAPVNSNFERSGTPLIMAIKIGCIDLIEMLCSQGADVNRYGYTNPLVLAVEKNRCDIINVLIKHGVEINVNGTCGALEDSIANRQEECAKVLLRHGAKIDAEDAISAAVRSAKIESFLFLKDNFTFDLSSEIRRVGAQLLCSAAADGNKEMISLLLQEGADINGCSFGQTPLVAAENPDMMEFLINLGADVNTEFISRTSMSFTVLNFIFDNHWGRMKEDLLEKVKLLLKYGAKINITDADGNSTLMKASKMADIPEVLKVLIQSGADVNKQNKIGEHALHMAIKYGYIHNAKVLLEHQADIDLINETGMTPLLYSVSISSEDLIEFLIQSNANVEIEDKNGDTPLLKAIRSERNTDIINALIEAGACVNHQNKEGCSALMLLFSFRETIDVVNILLKSGACVNLKNNEGYTALMLAARNQSHDEIKALCEAGADINAVNDKTNESTLSIISNFYLTKRVHDRLIVYLLENGANASCLDPAVIHLFISFKEITGLKIIIPLGVGPITVDPASVHLNFISYKKVSPFMMSLICGYLDIARFLNDIWYLTPTDMQALGYLPVLKQELKRKKYSKCVEFLDEYLSQPMSLQKLSFVVVSSAVGADPGREERILALPVPELFRKMLLFKHSEYVEIEELTGEIFNFSDSDSLDDED